jgi:hypothetical protein
MGQGNAQPNSREYQRKILHKSLNNNGVHANKHNAHLSMDGQIGGIIDRSREGGKSQDPNGRNAP